MLFTATMEGWLLQSTFSLPMGLERVCGGFSVMAWFQTEPRMDSVVFHTLCYSMPFTVKRNQSGASARIDTKQKAAVSSPSLVEVIWSVGAHEDTQLRYESATGLTGREPAVTLPTAHCGLISDPLPYIFICS